MDMEWSAADLAFRDEVRAFLREHLDADLVAAGRRMTSGYADHAASMRWQAILDARGWAAPAWGGAHGGQDWTVAQHYIFTRELAEAGAPSLSPMGIAMVAHVIIRFGTPDQQAYFLPRILSGEIFFCQGYSEPEAGSDLASLKTQAVIEGDDLIINGSKIWTTHAREANWMFALVRTSREGRKQQGITFVLIDMATPGIDIRPLTMTSGEEIQTQVFFTDVRVPKANVLGGVDQGWGVAKYLLEFERGSFLYAPAQQLRAAQIADYAATAPGDRGGALIDDPLFEAKLAEARIRADVLEVLELRLLSRASEGGSTGAFSSMIKTLGTELEQDITELALEAVGPVGAAFQPHAAMPGGPVPRYAPPADGHVAGGEFAALAPLRYLNFRAGSIYGGSNEVQRNILAKMVLGL
jgi:alkylation response protein AidB-like acyl-CoA dehydrogenase